MSIACRIAEDDRPAPTLHTKHGFKECPPFADYVADGFSICMSRDL